MSDDEIRLGAESCKFVPRANELTVVATVDAVANAFAERQRDSALELDGQIRDATTRIHLVGCDDCLRGTGNQTARAGSAMV